MKKIAWLLFLVLAAAVVCLTAAAEDAVIEISDIDGLRDVVSHPGAHFRLTNDIDLEGVDWTPIPFSGELDGGGFGIYNLTVTRVGEDIRTTYDGNAKTYDTTFAGLFSVAEEATIRNLKIIGAHVAVTGKTHCFAAILAGYAQHCTIENVTVDGRVRLDNEAVMSGVGGISGFGSGYIHYCTARVELIYVDNNHEKPKSEQFLGAMMATGYAHVQYCTVDIDGYVSCFGYCHNGGLMGMFYTSGTKFQMGLNNRIVNHNTVRGRIYFFEHNPDRRAYCKGDVGETRTKLTSRKPNDLKGFVRKETKEYRTTLLPETCENPVYTEEIVPPADGEWGYTLHTCIVCGYSWRDHYTPPENRQTQADR